MKALKALAFGLVLALAITATADDKKEVKLTGSITCAKCDLGEAKKCETVIVVKEKDKKLVYHFDKESHKKYHGDTCQAAKEGTVTGTTAEVDKKWVVTVKSLEYKK
jgi:hypothetical protein